MKTSKKWFMLLGVILVVFVLALYGYGGKEPDPAKTQPQSGGEPTASQPESGDAGVNKDMTLVVGIPSITDTFNPYTGLTGFESSSRGQVYDTLLYWDDKGELAPMLCENYEIADDATSYTFYLRKDATFSDGSPITAEDVKFSLDSCASSDRCGSPYHGIYDHTEIIDEHTVKVHLLSGNVAFIQYLASVSNSEICSKAAFEKYGDSYGSSAETIVSSGPYVVTEWVNDEYIVYKYREDYYRGVPDVKNFRLVKMTDVNTAIVALQTGEMQCYLNDIPGVSMASLESAEGIATVNSPSTVIYNVYMNCSRGVFSDIRMRKAIAYATNKEDMIIVGSEGYGSIANYIGDRGGTNIGDPKLGECWPYSHDLEKAAALVKECGHEGLNVVIKTYSTDPYPALATVLQNSLNKIGLNATVQQMERATFIEETMGNGNFDISLCRYATNTNDMDESILQSLHTRNIGYPGNWSWYSNPDLDVILDSSQRETDPEARKAIFANIIQVSLDDIPFVPMYYTMGCRAYSDMLTINEYQSLRNLMYDFHWAE